MKKYYLKKILTESDLSQICIVIQYLEFIVKCRNYNKLQNKLQNHQTRISYSRFQIIEWLGKKEKTLIEELIT